MIERFLQLLLETTSLIQPHYFQLPVAGVPDAISAPACGSTTLRTLISREAMFADCALSGEIDKQGHPLIRQYSPDFVLHVPGRMQNYVIVEVKPITGSARGIRKDRKTIEYFLSADVGYTKGVHLVYGDGAINRFEAAWRRQQPASNVDLLWHRQPGEQAHRIDLNR